MHACVDDMYTVSYGDLHVSPSNILDVGVKLNRLRFSCLIYLTGVSYYRKQWPYTLHAFFTSNGYTDNRIRTYLGVRLHVVCIQPSFCVFGRGHAQENRTNQKKNRKEKEITRNKLTVFKSCYSTAAPTPIFSIIRCTGQKWS